MSIERRYALLQHVHDNGSGDHGDLTGLSDDDHPQYPLAAGTETISGAWTFTSTPAISGATLAALTMVDGDGGTDEKAINIRQNTGQFSILLTDDDTPGSGTGAGTALAITRSAKTPLTFQLPADNYELRFGASGDDLAIYHDGTNNKLDSNTGNLIVHAGGDDMLTLQGGTSTLVTVGDGGAATSTSLTIDGAAGTTRNIQFASGGSARWTIRVNATAESGSNAGSDLSIINRDDSAGILNQNLIVRSTGQIQWTSAGASTPTYSFNGDSDTGVGRPAANEVGLFAGGTEVLTTTTTGVAITGNLTVSGFIAGADSVIAQASDLVITSDNAFQDTDLAVSLTAGSYLIEVDAFMLSHSTPDMQIRPNYTGTITSVRHNYSNDVPVSVTTDTSLATISMSQTQVYGQRWRIHITVSDAGTFSVQARQITSSATSVTFYRGSSMRVTPL